ncbi:MAG TPA: Ig-like domain-containing protein [Acidimicrobiales bacterium]|nr:Ig-like domain-containing protein [Acidimicrobiales bacterium]
MATRGAPQGHHPGRCLACHRHARDQRARRAAASRGGPEAGFSIAEVAIAVVILLTVLVSVATLMGTIFKVGAISRFKQEATEIASSTLDAQVATGATTLLGEVGFTSLPSVTSSGQTYLLEMEVSPYNPATAGCVSPASDPGAMLKVSVWATWTDQTSGSTWWKSGSSSYTQQQVEETSLVAVPSSLINPLLGSILVTVENASGAGVSGLTVTATPSSGTALTATTTDGGCALFSNITATSNGSPTWTVSFSPISGYITEQELSSLPSQSNLSVTAGATTSLSFVPTVSPYDAYDQAATVTPVYSVPVTNGLHPALPTNISSMPLSFYNSYLTVNPYVSASPASVFPMPTSPSYYVVSGSCGSDSAPDGGTTDGQAVTVAAGGTASPGISLVPLTIYVNYNNSLVSAAGLTASASNAAGTGADSSCPTSGTGVMPTLQLGSTTATWTAYHPHKPARHVARLVFSCSSNCSTTTVVSSSPNPSTVGASVTFTATVSCTSTCSSTPGATSVQFKDGSTVLGNGSLSTSNGDLVATYTTSALALGSHSITAVYNSSNTSKWKNSTSSSYAQVVNGYATTTTLTGSPNPTSYGTSVLLTATVGCSQSGCGSPTGTVKFTNNGSNITGCTSVAVSSGTATCTLSGLAGNATYSVVATYTPTSNYQSSTSSTLSEVVTAASTTTVLTSTANPSPFGTSITLTATVTPVSGAPAAGSVTFTDGPTTLGTATVNGSGVATYSTSTLTVGSHALSASFTPTNSNNFGTSSGQLTQVVNAPAGAAFTLTGLPYGVWLLSATYTVGPTTYRSSNESVQVVVKVTPSGFYVGSGGTFGSLQSAGSPVTVYVK